MAILHENLDTFNLEHFTWDKQHRRFVTEASTLEANYGRRSFRRIYDDSLDSGFKVRNPNTGRQVIFARTREVYGEDGDLTHVLMAPIPEDVQRNPALKGVELHILND